MTTASPTPVSIDIHDGLKRRDLAWFGVAVLAMLVLVPMLLNADGETITTVDSRTRAEGQTPVWLGALIMMPVALFWPAVRCWSLLTRRRVATADTDGIRLYKTSFADFRNNVPVVNVAWDEVDRIVLWRWRTRTIGSLSLWRTQVGV
ncbi:MAG: hypothetical protein ACRD0P_31670, partial [Stackebrandtia sp.]